MALYRNKKPKHAHALGEGSGEYLPGGIIEKKYGIKPVLPKYGESIQI